jgi:carbamoyl-phosphate synthase small subunit
MTSRHREERFHIVCYDFGVKRNSLREFAQLGVRTTVVPASTSAADALALNPDGIFLSNGPGDSGRHDEYVKLSRFARLLRRKRPPVLRILLWSPSSLVAAVGAQTFKHNAFGHSPAESNP